MLPGFFNPMIARSRSPITLVGVGAATGINNAHAAVTLTEAAQPGDLLVALVWCNAEAIDLPSGYTAITPMDGYGLASSFLRVYCRVASGGETSAPINNRNDPPVGARATTGTVVHFRAGAAGAAGAGSWQFTGSAGGKPADITVALSGSGPTIAFGTYHSTGAIDPRGMSPEKSGEFNAPTASGVTHTYGKWIAWKIFDSGPTDVTISMDDEGNNNHLFAGAITLTV